MTTSITYADGRQESVGTDRGVFGSLLQLRRERKQREARAAREARLVKLDRDIKALETWHHEWRLRWDKDYRTLHPGEWCGYHKGPRTGCEWLCTTTRSYGRMLERRRVEGEDVVDIVTWDGRVVRRVPAHASGTVSPLTTAERRQATRNVVDWVRSQVDVP